MRRPFATCVVAVVTAATLALVLAPTAQAIHQVDHRYVVLGYVRDATGRPVAGRVVRVVRQKTGLALEAETDADGFYVVIAHLHDEDLLDRLWVAVGPRVALWLEARFNPFDSRTPRGTRVDFTDGVPREQPDQFAAALERYVSK